MKKEYIRYLIFVVAIVIIILVEQLLKIYIIENYKGQETTELVKSIVHITYIENKGGAWGIGQNDTATFIISNILVLGIIIRFIVTQRDRVGILTLVSLGMILAGGISNLVDRLFRGYVVDYIDITPLFNFPVFNLEDTIIMVGWLLFIVMISVSAIKLKNEKVEDRIEKNSSE